MIAYPHRLWKEFVNMMHLHIFLCCITNPVRRRYAISSRFSYNSWIPSDFFFYYLWCPKSFSIPSISWWTKSPFLGNQTSRPQMDHTIPQRSYHTCKFPWTIFNSFYDNAWKSSHKYLHNWIHKHEEGKYNLWIFALQKRKGIPIKMFLTSCSFASRNGCC